MWGKTAEYESHVENVNLKEKLNPLIARWKFEIRSMPCGLYIVHQPRPDSFSLIRLYTLSKELIFNPRGV